MSIRMTGLAAFAAAMLLVGAQSDASFSYKSAESPTTITTNGSTLTLSGNSAGPGLSGTTNINSVNVADTSTNAPGTPNTGFSLTFTDTVTITPSSDGPVVLAVSETLNFTRSDTGGSLSTLTVNSVLPVSGQNSTFRYAITAFSYAQPTVGGGTGNISYTITETAVPEPASLGMVALGLGFAGFVGFRRSRRSA